MGSAASFWSATRHDVEEFRNNPSMDKFYKRTLTGSSVEWPETSPQSPKYKKDLSRFGDETNLAYPSAKEDTMAMPIPKRAAWSG
mmetsp:Transcript_49767/g.105996  ORF Transcript_49767/g.105996 Transcript_49767/m.105996 type:complete len:85 (-) Transcript_49767:102-356(-)